MASKIAMESVGACWRHTYQEPLRVVQRLADRPNHYCCKHKQRQGKGWVEEIGVNLLKQLDVTSSWYGVLGSKQKVTISFKKLLTILGRTRSERECSYFFRGPLLPAVLK